MTKKIAILLGSLLISVFIYFDIDSMIMRNKLPLSGARPFSQDLAAGKFKNTVFIFIPDSTTCTIDYYLRHDNRVKDIDAILSTIHGCARWTDKTPCVPDQYGELFKNPSLLKVTEDNISDLPLDKCQTLILVRESSMPNKDCHKVAQDLQRWLDNTYKFRGFKCYIGRLEGYVMFVYDRS